MKEKYLKNLEFYKIVEQAAQNCVCPEAVSYTHLDVYKRQGLIHRSFPDGCLKGIPASHVGQNPDLRVVHFDCFGQGTAYQSQPDKTNCFYLHVHTPFKLQMKGRLFRRIIRTGISALCSSEFLV